MGGTSGDVRSDMMKLLRSGISRFSFPWSLFYRSDWPTPSTDGLFPVNGFLFIARSAAFLHPVGPWGRVLVTPRSSNHGEPRIVMFLSLLCHSTASHQRRRYAESLDAIQDRPPDQLCGGEFWRAKPRPTQLSNSPARISPAGCATYLCAGGITMLPIPFLANAMFPAA